MNDPSTRELGALSPLWDFMRQMADIYGESADVEAADIVTLTVEIPIELEITAGDSGGLSIASAPPTQQIETTFMPVLHCMQVTVTARDASNAE